MSDTDRNKAEVIRYVVTYFNEKQGYRTLTTAAQGRCTHETHEQAAQALSDTVNNNTAETLEQVFGKRPRFEVRACPCWPNHFDPKQTVFPELAIDEPDTGDDDEIRNCHTCNIETVFQTINALRPELHEWDICPECEYSYCSTCYGGYEEACKNCRPDNWLELAEADQPPTEGERTT